MGLLKKANEINRETIKMLNQKNSDLQSQMMFLTSKGISKRISEEKMQEMVADANELLFTKTIKGIFSSEKTKKAFFSFLTPDDLIRLQTTCRFAKALISTDPFYPKYLVEFHRMGVERLQHITKEKLRNMTSFQIDSMDLWSFLPFF